jgi:hypothetical protein
MPSYVNAISKLFLEDGTNTMIKVKARLSEKSITTLGPAYQGLGIEIPCKEHDAGICLGHKVLGTTILTRLNMQHAYRESAPTDSNVKLHLAMNQG